MNISRDIVNLRSYNFNNFTHFFIVANFHYLLSQVVAELVEHQRDEVLGEQLNELLAEVGVSMLVQLLLQHSAASLVKGEHVHLLQNVDLLASQLFRKIGTPELARAFLLLLLHQLAVFWRLLVNLGRNLFYLVVLLLYGGEVEVERQPLRVLNVFILLLYRGLNRWYRLLLTFENCCALLA